MDPYVEQRLRDEVIYLHSLWRQGPPSQLQNPNPNLHLSNPTLFKKTKKPKPRTKKVKKVPPESHSGIEWPCPEPAPPTTCGWPALKLPPAPATRPPSVEEQARFEAAQAQQRAVKAAQEYFADSDSDSDEEALMEEDDDESEEQRFFSRVFTENGELGNFYKKKWGGGGGDFCCLVCGGIGKKAGKRFKNCVALVQHANGIAKTKKKRAHRALAQVICQFLGWDIDKLPSSIVASLGKSIEQGNAEVGMVDSNVQNQNLGMESDYKQGNAEVGMEDSNLQTQNLGMESVDNCEMMVKEVFNVGLDEVHIPGISDGVGDSEMLIESSSEVGAANECMENVDSGNLSMADGKTGVVAHLVKCLVFMQEPCKGSGIGNEIKNDQNGIVLLNDLKDNEESQK